MEIAGVAIADTRAMAARLVAFSDLIESAGGVGAKADGDPAEEGVDAVDEDMSSKLQQMSG